MTIVNYDVGFVAFIDVLGWSHAIERSVQDSELRTRMARVQSAVLQRASEILDPNDSGAPSLRANTYGYQFSDANILAVPQRESTRAGAEFVALWCRLIAREYFRAGLLVRGGVTIGRIFCEQGVCFGPALTRAYKLEQSAAQPMVVIDPCRKVQDYFCDEEQYGALSSEGPHTNNLFAKTADGRLFVDYLRPDPCTNPRYRPLDVFQEDELSKLLEKFSTEKSDPLDVREKKSWFQRYARGDWRPSANGEFVQVNFQPRRAAGRRRLVPENFIQDFP